MMWNGYGMGGWGMAAMVISNLLFWALLAGAAFLIYRSVTRNGPKPDGSTSAVQRLGERYARGEIDDQEYQHRLTVLRQ
jgi:putative membrane protein